MFGAERVKVYKDSLGKFSKTSYGMFGAERVKVYRDSLVEFSNTSYGVFGAERVKVYRDSLGEFSNMSYGVFGAEMVNEILTVLHVLHNILQTCSCSFKNFNKIFCFALFVVLQLRKKIIKKINDA